MRCLLGLLLCLFAVADAAAQSAPPHAWLFGVWTGGLFPAPRHPTAAECLAHPTVIFTQDVVLRATVTDVTYAQRVVATARTVGNNTDFTFAPAEAGPGAGTDPLTGLPAGGFRPGFGCGSPDALRVHRITADEISFPGCADFPSPLVRCPAR